MATLEQVIEEARQLSPDEQRQLREMLDREARIAQVRQVQAKYAHITTSSDAHAARKTEEIELEERHSNRVRS